MKSLAHPEWPYTGTPHEWRGFVKRAEDDTWDFDPSDYTPMDDATVAGLRPYGIEIVDG